ncbi:MAG: ABC transporter-related protein [Candidatus Uhrbacteria bacterium GW2011_GWF2_39_13]|uniref:ABC transporter-related protein n=1 Tax=Candidatus Uhrbacteria bacterium GW2011_GWF2_39_13 TaxID=1618995 RepID=A0A0G0MIK4_9BACT|nr:MAG: ABC transporter-related protein [Candidatus Uhrbacteria bacterium GW2011_GWF2_39_13]
MLDTLNKIWQILNIKERYSLIAVSILIFIGSALELAGIGMLLPFIALLSDVENLTKKWYLKLFSDFFKCESPESLLTIMAVILIIFFMAKNFFLFTLTFIQSKFINHLYRRISDTLFKTYMHSSYAFHLQKNSAHLLKNLQAVYFLCRVLMSSVMILFSELLLISLIACFLVILYPYSSTVIISLMIVFSSLFYYFMRKKIKYWGEVQHVQEKFAIQHVKQGLAGIKEAKLMGCEDHFCDLYENNLSMMAKSFFYQDVLNQSPRLYIETLSVVLCLSFMIYYFQTGMKPGDVFIEFSLLAIVAIRLMPSMNRIVSALVLIRFQLPSLHLVHADISSLQLKHGRVSDEKKIAFNNVIELENVSFRYEGTADDTLKHISVSVKKNSSAAFVGATGAGKTTIVDIILGLLKPQSGKVIVDGYDIHDFLSSWQKSIGYVPQDISLADTSIKENIAFGILPENVDNKRLERAVKISMLEDFIRELPEGLDTVIGEDGVRLSGGQRQRIGIARALYNDPEIIVLDEGTASLDNLTEDAVIKALDRLNREKKTIIIVAHRLSTVRRCDKIYFVKNGQIAATGTYDELIKSSDDFAQMLTAGQLN